MKSLKGLWMLAFILTLCSFGTMLTSCAEEDNPANLGRETKSTALFVATDRHENGEGNNLAAMLRIAVKGSEVKPRLVILGGDYVGSGGGSNPEFPISDLYNEIDSTLAPPYRDVVITYGSHDENCTDGYSAFFSGPRHQDGYYVYGISYAQMIYATDESVREAITLYQKQQAQEEESMDSSQDGTSSNGRKKQKGYNGLDIDDRYGLSAESASANFTAWVRTLTDNYPIVVMSHVPMHANRQDNLGATAWYNALSEAAEKHDIIFLWGHNHTNEEMALREQQQSDDSTTTSTEETGNDAPPPKPKAANFNDRYYYLLTPGENITLQDTVDSLSVERQLGFTYANAGYLKFGYASVITFTSHDPSGLYDAVTIRRYALTPDSTETTFGFSNHPNPFMLPLKNSVKGRK